MSLEERFLEYLSFNTEANKSSKTIPSSSGQIHFATRLADELKKLGLVDVEFLNGTLYGRKKSDYEGIDYSIGFVTHMDTYPMGKKSLLECLVIDDYNSEKLKNATNKIYPSALLSDLENTQQHKKVIFSKGNTNLGADDKAGIAVVITAIECVLQKNIPTSEIYFAFVSDEEIGNGSNRLDYSKYKADYSFVVDGEALGEISTSEIVFFSCFVKATGVYSFLGDASKIMVNSIELINRFIGNIDNVNFSQNNEQGDVYIHFDSIQGDVSLALLSCSIMSSSQSVLEETIKKLYLICDEINSQYGCNRVRLVMPRYREYNSYCRNENENIVKMLRRAMEENELEPNEIQFKGINRYLIARLGSLMDLGVVVLLAQ